MVSKCLVPGCNNKGQHSLPKNSARRSLWLKAMKVKEIELKLKTNLVCGIHFQYSDYTINYYEDGSKLFQQKFLKRHAVPSIFSWNEANVQEVQEDIKFVNFDDVNFSESASSCNQDPLINLNSSSSSILDIPSPIISDSETDIDSVQFDSSKVKNTYSKLYAPIKFVPEFPFNETNDVTKNPLSSEEDDFETQVYFGEHEIEVGNDIDITDDNSFDCNIKQEENDLNEEENKSNVLTDADVCHSCGQSKVPSYSIHKFKNRPTVVHFNTGLESFEKLIFVFYSLGDLVNNLNYFYGKPPDHLDSLEQFCMTLLILRRHREFEDVAVTYETNVKQVTNIFITWIRFMALQWRTIDLWIDRQKVNYYMPLDFNDKYPKTRTIIDATECPIQRPFLPSIQQQTFSSYKNKNTVKFLIGIAPSGLITYLSPCYGGSTTDRQIIERSAILDKFDYNDEIMVDKGINVQDIFLSRGVKVNMPTFFKKGNQIDSNTLSNDRKIASKRVHIERVIGMLKTYKILTQPMNHTETLLSSDITFVIAMLVNFRSNIINKNA